MKARYIRVSTDSQSIARQEKQNPNERVYIDVISGSVAFRNRPAGKQLLQDIEAGLINYISFSQLDRCGRSAIDIQNTLDYFKTKGVCVWIDNLGVKSLLPDGKPNPSFKMITDILANLAEMQRESIRENQEQGIKAAKDRGDVYKGRLKGTTESDAEVLNKYKKVIKIIKEYPTLSNNKIGELGEVSPHTVKKIKDILEKQKG